MRGVFERPAGSNVWWILYYVDGKRRREKVGRKSDAAKLYQARKASGALGVKLPELRKTTKTTISDLVDLVVAYTANHKDAIGYIGKSKLIKAGLGDREAASLTPTDIEQWLSTRSKTAATYNRYKAFLSLAYRLGIRERKVSTNPARDALHRKEPGGRERFLSRDEYTVLHDVIARKYPAHLAEFVVSVHSGMRLGEQYLCRWAWYRPDRSVIRLPGSVTKNGKSRDVVLNADSVAAIEFLRRPGQKGTDRIFPREVKATRKGTKDSFDNRSWFEPCLAEAGIEGYVWHCNRHTFCSWLAMSGASILQIMVAAGHSGPAMAARYSHLSPQSEESPVHLLVKTPVAAA